MTDFCTTKFKVLRHPTSQRLKCGIAAPLKVEEWSSWTTKWIHGALEDEGKCVGPVGSFALKRRVCRGSQMSPVGPGTSRLGNGDPDWRPFWRQLRLRLRFQPGPRTCLAGWQTKAPSANSICREEWKSWRDVGGQVTTWSITRRRLATRSAAHIAKSWSFKELLA